MNCEKAKAIIGLRKANTSLSKIIKMAEGDAYCVDLMQQNLAVIGLLRSAHLKIMENHLNTCFRKAMEAKNEKKKQEMIEEILRVTDLFNR